VKSTHPLLDKALRRTVLVEMGPDDHTHVVNAIRAGSGCTRKLNVSELTLAQQKSSTRTGGVNLLRLHDLSLVVNTAWVRDARPWVVDWCKLPATQFESVCLRCWSVVKASDNDAFVVDAGQIGGLRAGHLVSLDPAIAVSNETPEPRLASRKIRSNDRIGVVDSVTSSTV
jgi:hypothetical protein